MVEVPSIERVKEKWERKATAATEDYRVGVESPRTDWKTATLNAVDTWVQGVQNAINNDLFRKGVEAVTTEDWKKAALELGVRRYADGVRASVDKYAKKMAKVLAILKEVTLPPRGPRGDTKNLDRVRVIMETLHKAKIEGRI